MELLTPSTKGHPRYTKKRLYDRNWYRKNAREQSEKARLRKLVYKYSPKWHLLQKYSAMKARVSGYGHSFYKHLPLLSKDEFLHWAINNKKFLKLFEEYKSMDMKRKYAPSIDRIDTTKGYIVGNLQFITVSENSKKYLQRRWNSGRN